MAHSLTELAARFRRIAGTDAADESLRAAQADGGRLVRQLIQEGRYTLPDDAARTYRSVAPYQAADARLREYQLSWLWQLTAADVLPNDMIHPNDAGNHAAAERYALAAELLAARIVVGTKSTADQEQAVGTIPAEPKAYLWGWTEILDAVGMKDNTENRRQVRRLNDLFDGPIVVVGSGSKPQAINKTNLLAWWNRLDDLHRELQQQERDKQATAADSYSYGSGGTVVPNIAGAVKKRRRDAKR